MKSKLNFTKNNLKKIHNKSLKALDRLITKKGIYASGDGRWVGRFHHFFGRDSAITTLLVFEAEKIIDKEKLAKKALSGLLSISHFQGKQNDTSTGECIGKIPHEIVTTPNEINKMLIKRHLNSWYVDPKDHYIKNWDSVDSSALWIYVLSKYMEDGWMPQNDIRGKYIKAVKWCLSNLNKFHGYNGWLPAEKQSGRKYGGLHNQTWKDSDNSFEYKKGGQPKYPLYDIYSNAITWAALKNASDNIKKYDKKLNKRLKSTTSNLKINLNKQNGGFWNGKNKYYAEALDSGLKQLSVPSIDPAMSMAFNHNNETVFNKSRLPFIINEIMSNEIHEPGLGLRNYSKKMANYQKNDEYDRGPNTIWPFANGLVVMGLVHNGFLNEARIIAKDIINGVQHFKYFIELFQINGTSAIPWHIQKTKQTSAHNQAWTAAAIYYVTAFLLKYS